MSSATGDPPGLPSDEPAPAIDYAAFERDLLALRAAVDERIGPADVAHLRKLERWGRACTALGYATAWIAPNPVSAFLLGQGSTFRWTVMAHHVAHRAFDGVPGAPERYTSKRFAAGARRLVDWLDWILPEAWRHEHNVLHHGHTGEEVDPDLVERNARAIREASWPLPIKYAAVAFYACTWKLTYYAPATFLARVRARERSAREAPQPGDWFSVFSPARPEGREFLRRCVLPYAAVRFGAVPALFLPLGPAACANVLLNTIAAEIVTNAHTFLLVVPSHAGGDLCRFDGRAASRAEHHVRQVLGTANYTTGGDVTDFLHGFLNYQIEHHLFPDLPPLRYREIAPEVAAVCARHGLPYVQESVLRRAGKLLDVMVGKASMRRVRARPKAESARRAAVAPRAEHLPRAARIA
jgi:fatty acid desaturase